MRFRDSYGVTLTCPKCKTSGDIKVSEEGYPFMRGLHFLIDEMHPAFVVHVEGLDLRDTVFHCQACDLPADKLEHRPS